MPRTVSTIAILARMAYCPLVDYTVRAPKRAKLESFCSLWRIIGCQT